MKMGMPVMCFDIGAPAERVKKYEKGIIIPKISATSVYETITRNQVIKECCNKKINTQKYFLWFRKLHFHRGIELII